jgi:hypothetical protein
MTLTMAELQTTVDAHEAQIDAQKERIKELEAHSREPLFDCSYYTVLVGIAQSE